MGVLNFPQFSSIFFYLMGVLDLPFYLMGVLNFPSIFLFDGCPQFSALNFPHLPPENGIQLVSI